MKPTQINEERIPHIDPGSGHSERDVCGGCAASDRKSQRVP